MPFVANQYTPPAGSESATPGAVVQSAVWNAIFTDLAAALTLVAEQTFPTPTVIAGIGTSQASSAAIGALNFYVRANSQSGQIALSMPSSVSAGGQYRVFNTGPSTAVVWPPSGGLFLSTSIAGVTATGISLAIGRGAIIMVVTATTFDVLISD